LNRSVEFGADSVDRQQVHSAATPSGTVLDGSPDHEPPNPLVEAAVARSMEQSEHDLTSLHHDIADLERLASEAGSARARRWAWHHRGRLRLLSNHLDEAIGLLEAALTSFEEGGEPLGTARTRALLGLAYCSAGDSGSGLDHLGSALDAQKVDGDRWGEARTLTLFGEVFASTHRYEEALLVLGEAEVVFRSLGDDLQAALARTSQASVLNARAHALAAGGQHEHAHRIFSANADQFADLVDLARRAGHDMLAAHATRGLGNARAGLGDHAVAAAFHLEAARLGRRAGDTAVATRADIDRCRSLGHIESRAEALTTLYAIAADDEQPPVVRAEASMLAAELHERVGDLAAAYRALRFGCRIEKENQRSRQKAVALGSAAGMTARRLQLESQLARLEVDRLAADAEDRSRLIAAVAHELRTPLTAVHGFATAMVAQWEEWSATDLKEMVELIAEQSMDATNIVEDLLTASGVTRGTLQVIPTVVDIAATIRGELTGLEYSLDAATPCAMADSFRVRQIVRNLISNARRYGGHRISVAIGHDAESVFVDVVDDGPGIPASEEHRVFEPFARSRSADRVATSMGLGLPVSRELAHLMGGTLTYRRESELTVFRLRVPFAPTQSDGGRAS
jgi:signal transduction histidine kinase